MKKVSITVTEDEAHLLRELIKHQVKVHIRNAEGLERRSKWKVGGYVMAGDREKHEQARKAMEALVSTHRELANSFNIILENISGRMFQKGIKFDPINFIKNKILKK